VALTIHRRISREAGFSLPEVMVAVALAGLAATSVVQLFPVAIAANLASKDDAYATVLASQKVEALRSSAEDVSAADALEHDTAGQVEYLDATGSLVDASGAVFTRRWAVRPLPSVSVDAVAIGVRVFRTAHPRAARDVRLFTVVTRRPR
jgi:prepilin-type N-terminal cleavage/methylation domain-containing protein